MLHLPNSMQGNPARVSLGAVTQLALLSLHGRGGEARTSVTQCRLHETRPSTGDRHELRPNDHFPMSKYFLLLSLAENARV